MLKEYIQGIREDYTNYFNSKDMTKRQIAVATYLIDKVALRAGNENEKDDVEADSVGCYIANGKCDTLPTKYIRGKSSDDDLFEKLDANKPNAHLKQLMPGLTAKVFCTYSVHSMHPSH